jgi:hypothetical protein
MEKQNKAMNQPGLKNQPEADKAKDAILETFKEI